MQQTFGSLCALYGVLLIVGASLGHSNPWLPLQPAPLVESKLPFTIVTSPKDLEVAIKRADGKPVLIDFYADWCVSCKALDRVFYIPEITALLQQFHLVRVDMTHPSSDINAILERWHVIAPPTLIFLNAKGQPSVEAIVGAVNSSVLQEKLQTALAAQE